MPQDKWSAATLCPYYRKHSEVGIYCEGPVTNTRGLDFDAKSERLIGKRLRKFRSKKAVQLSGCE